MNIHQLSVNYIQEHDRILVRINTTAGQELRVWFTRRLALGLQPMLQNIVAQWVAKQEAVKLTAVSPTAAADVQTQQMLSEFKREEFLQQSDFKTPYKEPHALPLGPEPLLVTEISVTPLPTGQLQISFNEKLPLGDGQLNANPRGFRLALEQKLVHGFVHLLEKAVSASQWAGHTAGALAAAQTFLPGENSDGGSEGDLGGGPGSDQRSKYLNY
jgi:hypothetical protein